MEMNYYKSYSPALGRDMECKVYGHKGRPVLFIPCQDGRFYDFENFHMTDTWAPWIESGTVSYTHLISDPERSYHFEIVCTAEAKAHQLQDIIKTFGMEAKIVMRKKYYVVYIKEGSQIADILKVMEAPISLMELENIRILKEMRGSVNRQVNCETANINKTVSAAVKQIEDIVYIRDTIGFEGLPENLEEIAKARLERPEATLKELGEGLDPPVGKSGVNHRLRKLSILAADLKEKRSEQ